MNEPTLITDREEISYFFPENGETFELEEVQKAVEVVRLDDYQTMI